MRIVVLGAGGLGSYVGAILHDAGHRVTLVARGSYLEAIRRDGLRVVAEGVSRRLDVPAVSEVAAAGDADLTLVTPKAYDLDAAADALAAVSHGVVVPLTNGVDAVERLAGAGVEARRLLQGVAYVTAFRIAPGAVERRGRHGRLILGRVGAVETQGRDAVDAVGLAAVLSVPGLEVTASDRVTSALWSKMAVVCSLVSACALGRDDLGPVRARPQGRRWLADAVDEVLSVARARDADLEPDASRRIREVLAAFPDDFHPSLVHDLRMGRRTEIDALNGTIVRLAGATGVDTPVADATVRAVRGWNGPRT